MPSGRLCTIAPTPRREQRVHVKTPALAIRLLTLAAALAALLVLAAPATAAKACGRAVIDDWYEDGRVDGTYALHCYDEAIDALPRDVRDYSSAKEDIQRALQARKRGEDAPPATTDPTPGASSDPDDPSSSGGGGGGSSGTPGAGPSDGDDGGLEAAPTAETESASSVPIPLLILAGLALLLVAAGSAGYLIRRLQARRVPRTTT
jgi:cobalamin biosynthesis Mg chelatase CobN